MKIYFAHTKGIDYINNYYNPIKERFEQKNVKLIFPHEKSENIQNSRDFYNGIDIIFAELSMPSTGVGIELGWAYDSKKPIVCLYKKGTKVNHSVSSVTDHIIEYETTDEMIEIIKSKLEEILNVKL